MWLGLWMHLLTGIALLIGYVNVNARLVHGD